MDLRNEISAQDRESFHAQALMYVTASRSLIGTALAGDFEIKRKPDKSFVTSVDLHVEEHLRDLIQQHFPDHGIIGEEFPPSNPQAAFQWIMDPIDGTEDFIQGIPTFGTILALHYRGEPVVGVIDHPLLDIRVSAAFGLGTYKNNERVRLVDIDPAAMDGSERAMLPARANFIKHADDGHLFDAVARAHPNHRIFRTCYTHTCAVIGSADATIDYGNPIWDFSASRILVEEAGGQYTVVRAWEVPTLGRVYGTIFGKPALVKRLVSFFNES